MRDRSTKPQHHLYPQRNNGGRIHDRILILDTLRVFYLVQKKHLLTPYNLETRVMSKPFIKDFWNWTKY